MHQSTDDTPTEGWPDPVAVKWLYALWSLVLAAYLLTGFWRISSPVLIVVFGCMVTTIPLATYTAIVVGALLWQKRIALGLGMLVLALPSALLSCALWWMFVTD